MSNKTLAKKDPRIAQFCQLITDGIKCWIAAGKLLIEISADDPDAYDKIVESNPELTYDVLLSFERIGRKELYPKLLLDNSPGARALTGLPYPDQVRLYNTTVPVVRRSRFGLGHTLKHVSELSDKEVSRVFDGDKVRSIAEQSELVRAFNQRLGNYSNPRKPAVVEAESDAETAGAVVSDLNEPISKSVVRLLGVAQDSILEARSGIAQLKLSNAPQCNNLISACLNYLGNLRYHVNEVLDQRGSP